MVGRARLTTNNLNHLTSVYTGYFGPSYPPALWSVGIYLDLDENPSALPYSYPFLSTCVPHPHESVFLDMIERWCIILSLLRFQRLLGPIKEVRLVTPKLERRRSRSILKERR